MRWRAQKIGAYKKVGSLVFGWQNLGHSTPCHANLLAVQADQLHQLRQEVMPNLGLSYDPGMKLKL